MTDTNTMTNTTATAATADDHPTARIIATGKIQHDGVTYSQGDEIVNMTVAAAQNLDAVRVETGVDPDESHYLSYTAPEPSAPAEAVEESALASTADEYLERVRALMDSDPADAGAVQRLDARIGTLQASIAGAKDDLAPLQSECAEAIRAVEALHEDLQDIRLSVVLGDAPPEVETQAEADLAAAEEQLEEATQALDEKRSVLEPRIDACKSGLADLTERRHNALVAERRRLLLEAEETAEEMALVAVAALREAYRVAQGARQAAIFIKGKESQGWGQEPLPGGGRRSRSHAPNLGPVQLLLSISDREMLDKLRAVGLE